jgi:hypothetical protein
MKLRTNSFDDVGLTRHRNLQGSLTMGRIDKWKVKCVCEEAGGFELSGDHW